MQLSSLRAEIAALFLTTDVALYERQKQLRAVPALRDAGMIGHGGRDAGPPATPATAAILMLAAMLGQNRHTIGERTGRMWQARCVRPFDDMPTPKTLGALLTLLLQRADLRADLDYLELNHNIPDFLLMFKNQSRLFYAPYKRDEWKRRVDRVAALTHISKLPATALDKIAVLIATDRAADKNPQ
jgi:hypothetical protein